MATQNEEGRLSNDKAYNVVTKQYYTSQETRDSRYVALKNLWFSFHSIRDIGKQELLVLFHLVLSPCHFEVGVNDTEGLKNLCSFEQNIFEGIFSMHITKHTNSNLLNGIKKILFT